MPINTSHFNISMLKVYDDKVAGENRLLIFFCAKQLVIFLIKIICFFMIKPLTFKSISKHHHHHHHYISFSAHTHNKKSLRSSLNIWKDNNIIIGIEWERERYFVWYHLLHFLFLSFLLLLPSLYNGIYSWYNKKSLIDNQKVIKNQ